jgi:hypothetical protein
MGIHRRHSITRRSLDGRRRGTAFGQVSVGLVLAIAFVSTGCRSGTSTFSSPSWWAFGNSAGTDPEKLAAAPPFDGKAADGKITKPSQTATPYPTTTTPNGYSVADANRGLPNDPAAVATAPVEQAAVTYGSTPPPSLAPVAQSPAAPMTSPSTAPIAATPPPGGPQVGPYASLPGQIPTAGNAQPLAPPPLAGATPGSFPATAGYEPAARMADAATLPAAEPAAASRYSSSPSSRFGGGLEPAPSAPPATSSLLPAAPLSPPPAAPPASSFVPSPAASSVPQPVSPPAQGAMPSTPPTRRPDPGYRPGGTSSYRPARSILADEQPSPPSAVRTAAYEVPATPQR